MQNLKTLFSIFVFSALLSNTAFAQVGESADVAVSAEVVSSLTISNVSDINLGSIAIGKASYIQANENDNTNGNDDEAQANLGVGASAGQVKVTGATSTTTNVTFTNATLSDGAGKNLTFTPTVYFGSDVVTDGGSVTLTGGENLFDVGGQLEAPTDAGTYSTAGGSPVTITVQYN